MGFESEWDCKNSVEFEQFFENTEYISDCTDTSKSIQMFTSFLFYMLDFRNVQGRKSGKDDPGYYIQDNNRVHELSLKIQDIEYWEWEKVKSKKNPNFQMTPHLILEKN
ncbi:MAG: hypothetical protein ACI8Z7_000538 [Candidatus Nanohaloarchaea archaeon]|jgi:hypothetical protein